MDVHWQYDHAQDDQLQNLAAGLIVTQTDLIMFSIVAVIALLASPAIFYTLKSVRRSDRLVSRLESRNDGTAEKKKRKVQSRTRSVGDVFVQLGKRATPGNAEQLSAIRFKLMRAGFLSKKSIPIYFGVRLFMVVVPQLALLFFLSQLAEMHKFGPLMASLLLVVVGLILPDKFIESRTKKLEAEYSEGFPDMMDLMVACIEAGMSIDSAVTRVAEELVDRYPNLAMHLNIIALELRAGRSRNDAWKNFAQRLGLDAADSLATMLRQAEEMGSSVGDTLRVFSKDMRQKRMLAAEEQALALSAKLSLPLILFVFPTLLGVLMLPVVVQTMDMAG